MQEDMKDQINPEMTEHESAQQASAHEQQLLSCQTELAATRERYMRTLADFENYKKRIEKEKVAWMEHAQSKILLDLIAIVDDFDRAFFSLTSQGELTAQQQWIAGFTLIHQAATKLLDKYGIEEMKEYASFDPEKHEALLHVDSANHKAGDIVQVLQKGYMLNGRVLRPAKVSVAK